MGVLRVPTLEGCARKSNRCARRAALVQRSPATRSCNDNLYGRSRCSREYRVRPCACIDSRNGRSSCSREYRIRPCACTASAGAHHGKECTCREWHRNCNTICCICDHARYVCRPQSNRCTLRSCACDGPHYFHYTVPCGCDMLDSMCSTRRRRRRSSGVWPFLRERSVASFEPDPIRPPQCLRICGSLGVGLHKVGLAALTY